MSRIRPLKRCSVEPLESRGLLSNFPVLPPADFGAASPTVETTSGSVGDVSTAFGVSVTPEDAGSDGQVSVSSVAGISTQPADGSRSNIGPSTLVITFDQPVDSFDLGFTDFRLDRINDDGSTTSMFDPFSWPQEIANNDDGFSPNFTQITIPLDSPLPVGKYQIVLMGGTTLSDDLSNGRWDPFSDLVLSTFSVVDASSDGGDAGEPVRPDPIIVGFSTVGAGATVQSFTDLGTLGKDDLSRADFLTKTPSSNGVALYRFELLEGHHWLLGLGTQPQDPDGSFQTSMALYRVDASGSFQAISLGDFGAGLSISKDGDTYIGLDAGTYCLVVGGIFESESDLISTGNYQFGISVATADEATRVTNFTLNLAELNDTVPAGLSIQFSGSVALGGFSEANAAKPPLEVVDSNGKVWATLPWGYDAEQNVLTLVFGEQLPAGTYSLRISELNGLTDLAGWSPVAPGLASKILATWTVNPSRIDRPSSYLGIVWPASSAGISRSTDLSDHPSETYRFIIITPAFYKIQAQIPRGAAELRIVSADGKVFLDSVTDDTVTSYQIMLPVGLYTLEWIRQDPSAAQISWITSPAKLDFESLLNNGVGQWSTLNLGFAPVSEGSPEPGGSTFGPISQSPATTAPESPLIAVATQAPAVKTYRNPSPSGAFAAQPLLLTPAMFFPTGMPSSVSRGVATVGTAVSPGAVSVADSSSGLIGGIRYVRSQNRANLSDDAVEPEETEQVTPTEVPENQMIPGEAGSKETIASDDADRRSIKADQRALAATEWITRLGQSIKGWFEIGPPDRRDSVEAFAAISPTSAISLPSESVTRERDTRQEKPQEAGIGQAHFGLPMGVVLASAIAYQGREPIRRWWREGKANGLNGRRNPRGLLRKDDKGSSPKTDGANEPDTRARAMRGPHFFAARVHSGGQVPDHNPHAEFRHRGRVRP